MNLTINANLWLALGLLNFISLTLNLLFIFKALARKYPNLFYEVEE